MANPLTLLACCLGVVLTLTMAPPSHANTSDQAQRHAWLLDLQEEAIARGISARIVHEALDDFRPNPRVIALDRKQPEKKISFQKYRRNVITPWRVQYGAALKKRYQTSLAKLQKQTGVPPHIVLALWAVESGFGKNMGNFSVVNSLATLAYEGRRASFFRRELFAALRILEQENIAARDLRGSWAGAMGQCQFMPTTYLKYAKDGDGDGHRDIWGNAEDTMASIAHYLAAEGWQGGTTWGRPVHAKKIPGNATGLGKAAPLRAWHAMGVRRIGGGTLPRYELNASLVRPDGKRGANFLVYDNFSALMRWNRSTYFALSVGTLADKIHVRSLARQ